MKEMPPVIARRKIIEINKILANNKCAHHGLLGGSLGLLYYYFHAAKLLNDNCLHEKASSLLSNVFEDTNSVEGNLIGGLYSSGAAGLAFAVDYLQRNDFIDFDIDVEFEELDNYLFETALKNIEKDNLDYLHGAMGVFLYFTLREQTEIVNIYLNELSIKICNKAIRQKDGIYFCNIGLERLTKNDIDLGLAHGLSGLLLLLVQAWPFLNDKFRVETTIQSGIEYIIKHELPVNFLEQEFSSFPFALETHTAEISRVNRLAWCYGDLNQVLLLYRAGKLLGNSGYIAIADRIGLQTIERKSVESTLSTDSHFCHGSAGVAQFYKSLYTETLNYNYHTAYEYWINKTLSLIDEEIAINKYQSNPVSLLEGWAGVALVLTEFISVEKMTWSKAFLL